MKTRMRSVTILLFLTAFLFLLSPHSAQAASCTWNGASGDWDDPTHWSCGHVPGSGDEAIIDTGFTVTLNTSASVASLTLSNFNAYLTGSGDLTSGTINWSSGRMTGSGSTTATSVANFSGPDLIWLDSRTFNNAGVTTWNKTNYMIMGNSSVINNQAGAAFTVQSSGGWIVSGQGTFNNEGVFSKTSADTTRTDVVFINAATGTVNVESGTLVIDGNSASSGGAFYVESGATLRLSDTHNMSGNITCTGSGTIEIAGGVLNISGAYSFSGTTLISNGTLNLSPDTATATTAILTLSNFSGYLTGPGEMTADTINWISGRMTGSGSTTATSVANFSGPDLIWLDGRTFNNAGATTWNKTNYMIMGNSAVINNQAGAAFTVQSSGGWIVSGQGTFNNYGTLNLTTGKISVTTFKQEAGGITNLAIRGTAPLSDYCQINASDFYLTGPLNIGFTGGYTPQVGDHFILLGYSNNRSGDYSPVNITPVAGVYWKLTYEGKYLHLWAMLGLKQLYIPITLK